MAFNKTLVADQIVSQLIETQGIKNLCNRGFDTLVRPGATSVDVPKPPNAKVVTVGTAGDSTDRQSLEESTMVNVPLSVKTVPMSQSIMTQFADNGTLMSSVVKSASDLLNEYMDSEVLNAVLTTTNKTAISNSSLAWSDLVAVNLAMDEKKIPKTGRVIVIPTSLGQEFYAIDVIKNAASYNQNLLSTGQFLQVASMTFFISALQPTITVSNASKKAISGFWGQGVASIAAREGTLEEVYDPKTRSRLLDMNAITGAKLLDNDFAVVFYK